MDRNLIKKYLEYYKNGYSEIPSVAFIKAGFAESLQDIEAANMFKELMADEFVIKEIEKFTKKRIKDSKKVLTKKEKEVHLSNIVRNGNLYKQDKWGSVVNKDPRSVVAAVKELNLMCGDYSPTKNSMELTGKDGKPLSIENAIHLDITKLTDDELRKIDKSIED